MNASKSKGRPREFDMDEVLDSMIHVFWEKGYEGTSLADILEATGLQKGSIYKAFENKQEMFQKALERYILQNHAANGALIAKAAGPLAGIDAMLKSVVRESCSKENEFRGCLAVRSMMDKTAHDAGVTEVLSECVSAAEKGLAGLIALGQKSGEIRNDLPARSLAEALYCFISGMLATSRVTRTRARSDRLARFAVDMLKSR